MSDSLPLLPSNFLSYSKIVSEIFSLTDEFCKGKDNVTINIYTLFSARLEKWFNNNNISSFQIRCCRDWWHSPDNVSGYIDQIHVLALTTPQDRSFRKRFLRLVSVDKGVYDGRNPNIIRPDELYIYTENNKPHSFLHNNLMNMREKPEIKTGTGHYYFKGVRLLDGIAPRVEYLKSLGRTVSVFPIGTIDKTLSKKSLEKNWQKLHECFQSHYHSISVCNPEHNKPHAHTSEDNNIKALSPGVHYRYIDYSKLSKDPNISKDDFFCIEVEYGNQVKEAAFAIVFNQDEENDTSGIKLLDSAETKDLLESFKKNWHEHGTCNLTDILGKI